MRRVSAIAGACAVLAPLLLAGASSASAASGGSLTVHTIGRSGKEVGAQVEAYDFASGGFYLFDSGKAESVPKGTYDVIAAIGDDGTYQDETFAGRSVTVSGTTGVTLDARQGHAVDVGLSPSPAPAGSYDRRVVADVCIDGIGASLTGSASPGHVFVVPSSVKSLALSYGTEYDPESSTGGDYYLATGIHTGGLPSGLSATLHQSGLTALKVSARSGPDSGTADFDFGGDSGNQCQWTVNSLTFRRDLPNDFTAHIPAGEWRASEQGHDLAAGRAHTYPAGRTTALTFGHAVWGPGGAGLPSTSTPDHRLYFGQTNMFSDPTLSTYGAADTVSLKLTKSGRTLYSHTYTSRQPFAADPLLPSAGWYTTTEVAKRTPNTPLPSGALSTTSSLTLHFYADPDTNTQVRDYVTGFWPDALNTSNQAAPGSTTPIALSMRRDDSGDAPVPSDSVKSVSASYSTDGGKTWHTAGVKHSGGTWTASVPNPDSGRVSLRSTITDTHGDSSTTTVYNAYAIA